jgi:hypothetical protein
MRTQITASKGRSLLAMLAIATALSIFIAGQAFAGVVSTNIRSVTINDAGTASPYPSSVPVAGLLGATVTDVNGNSASTCAKIKSIIDSFDLDKGGWLRGAEYTKFHKAYGEEPFI